MNYTHFLPYTPSYYNINPYQLYSYQLPYINYVQPLVYTLFKPAQNQQQPSVVVGDDSDKGQSSKIQAQTAKNCSKIHYDGQLSEKQENSRPSSKVIFKYGKKNVESNVINQIFSYLSTRSKSKNSVYHLFRGSQEMICLYYQVMKQIKRKNKKYINRFYLINLIQMQQNNIGYTIFRKVDRENRMKLEKFRRILRVLTYNYLREICGNAILTSSKLDKQTKKEHLQRRREIIAYLSYHLKFGIKDNLKF